MYIYIYSLYLYMYTCICTYVHVCVCVYLVEARNKHATDVGERTEAQYSHDYQDHLTHVTLPHSCHIITHMSQHHKHVTSSHTCHIIKHTDAQHSYHHQEHLQQQQGLEFIFFFSSTTSTTCSRVQRLGFRVQSLGLLGLRGQASAGKSFFCKFCFQQCHDKHENLQNGERMCVYKHIHICMCVCTRTQTTHI